MASIIALTPDEKFIEYLNPDLINLVESNTQYGLKTAKIEYTVEDIVDFTNLFGLGNKIYVSKNNKSCLYVINTPVEHDMFEESKVSFEAEEVLTELNNAPFFTQTDLTAGNGFSLSNGSVIVNHPALDFWFGDYFSIGIIQDCLSPYLKYIQPTGTMSLMELLRFIEEKTGNVFVTRYEKDVRTNDIHKYLDFLNPKSSEKQWEFHIFYRFPETNEENTNIAN